MTNNVLPLIAGYNVPLSINVDNYIELSIKLGLLQNVWILVLGKHERNTAKMKERLTRIRDVYVARGNYNWAILLPANDIYKYIQLLQGVLGISKTVSNIIPEWVSGGNFEQQLRTIVSDRLELKEPQKSTLAFIPYLQGIGEGKELILQIYKPMEESEMSWYIPIEEVIGVISTVTPAEAFGILNQRLTRHGRSITFRHLVVKNEAGHLIGVVTKKDLAQYLAEHPIAPKETGQLNLGQVSDCMIPCEQVLQFPHTMSKEDIHNIIGNEKWETFIRAGAIFLVDEDNKIVGFETERGLW